MNNRDKAARALNPMPAPAAPLAALRQAPVDDEPETAEESRSIADARNEKTVSTAELLSEFGLNAARS